MVKYKYAYGRIAESLKYISEEMKEFEQDYISKTWKEYKADKKLQKLMDRTVENILTALIEISGTILIKEGIAAKSYIEVLKEISKLFIFSEAKQEGFAKLAIQRNRLAHRYLNLRWEAIEEYIKQREMIHKILAAIMEKEINQEGEGDSFG